MSRSSARREQDVVLVVLDQQDASESRPVGVIMDCGRSTISSQ